LKLRQLVLPAALFLALSAFAQQPQPKLSGDAIPNLGLIKTELKHYYDCDGKNGCYEGDLEQQASRAMEFLKQRAARRAPGEKLAVVLDIDETCLSNYPYYAITDFGYEPGRFDMWAMAADAAPIVPMLKVYDEARDLHMDVFFITGRPEQQRFATEQNLLKAGFKGWAGLTLRAPADASKKASDYKPVAREKIIQKGYKIVLNVGDQQSDLVGDPQAEMSVKLPNPFYFIP